VYESTRVGSLSGVPFDLDNLEVTGETVVLNEGIRSIRGPDYAFSGSGTLIYVPSGTGAEATLVWVDRKGQETTTTEETNTYQSPRLSPDGERITVAINSSGEEDIWIYQINSGRRIRLTVDGVNRWPIWTLDGSRIVFQSDSSNLSWKSADTSGEEEVLFTHETGYAVRPLSWTPDGQTLAFYLVNPTTNRDIWMLPLGSEPLSFLTTSFDERAAMFSPDGRWLAYVSNESGRDEVYVQPYPGPGGKQIISTEGGTEPVWAQDGRELFYRQQDQMMVVALEAGSTLSISQPQLLFAGSYYRGNFGNPNYDVSSDGKQFVMVKGSGDVGSLTQINVVLNWFEELKRLVPTE